MHYFLFKVNTGLRNDSIGKKVKVREVGYPQESDMPRLDMGGFYYIGIIAVFYYNYQKTVLFDILVSLLYITTVAVPEKAPPP